MASMPMALACILVSAGLALAAGPTHAKPLSDTTGAATFPAEDVLSGTTSTERQCTTFGFAVWVTVDGTGDCIRFYAANLQANGNARVLVYFHGDVLDSQRVLSGYEHDSPQGLQRVVADWSAQSGRLPFLFIGRPGVYGSSGDHRQRRRPREAKLVSAALDAIKARYGIGQYHLSGQSGGGTITAAMLNMRSDVECAVVSSGNVAVWRRVELLIQRSPARSSPGLKDTTGYTDSYDPVDHVGRIRRSPPPRILVLSDRNDMIVPFESQDYYVKQLSQVGLHPTQIILTATGPAHHALGHKARPALAWCAQGLPDSEIRRRLEAQAN